MKKINDTLKLHRLLGLLVLCGIAQAAEPASTQAGPQLRIVPAEHFSAAASAQILAASRAGKRIVAVGDHGVVMLSDDDGKTYRQARSVPVSSTLTAVSFADANTGWAVGHWGVILKTSDGGESWDLQRSDTKVDQPLFSVYFKDRQEGWAVGLWSLMLHTSDGGANWGTVKLPPPSGAKKADRNLYAILSNSKGSLFIASEQGRILRSNDGGNAWSYVETGYAGSFWSGLSLQDGTLLFGGQRGTIYRSIDDGNTWTPARSPLRSSITAFSQTGEKGVVASALDGVVLTSTDGGMTFTGQQRANRAALTAVIAPQDGAPIFFSSGGVVKP